MLAYALILAAVLSHVLPHPWLSFTAVGGALLVFGARRPLWQAVFPLALLAAADYYLTVYAYRYPFHLSAYVITWAWYLLAMVFGRALLRESHTAPRVIGAALLSSTSFFLVSNYAVWGTAGSFYPHTLAGLTTCYVAALPFYRNDVLSTTAVLALVFGLPALAARLSPAQRETAHRP
ncbi:MAG TPA: DUF6580 family putative transport protein [Acidobacteriaceae bacterium]